MALEANRERIIEIFTQNVLGRTPDIAQLNERHDGREGHWLEAQMGVALNNLNAPDLLGFEMKNDTTSKTTFGDWSPDYIIFDDKITREEFFQIFGHPNPDKGGRLSWSGTPVPSRNGEVSQFGVRFAIDAGNNISFFYSYDGDTRPDKANIVPVDLQREDLLIARWDADRLRQRVEDKFNQMGWFKCMQDDNGAYNSIVFGNPINFETFMRFVRDGSIFFDSGMYQGNPRPYSNWRANNSFWDGLVVLRHP